MTKARRVGSPLDDELDAIILRAMALAPEHRYQNAADLARDVQRYLAGEPVEAKRDRGLYVFRKLLYRYRVPVSIAAGFFFLLAIAFAVTTTLYVKVEEQRQVAQTERDRAVQAQQNADNRAEELRGDVPRTHLVCHGGKGCGQSSAGARRVVRLSGGPSRLGVVLAGGSVQSFLAIAGRT